MSESERRAARWKTILNVVTLAALAVLIYAIRHDLGRTLRDLTHVNGWALFLLVPVELINYHAQARLYQRLFGLVGNKLGYKFLYKTALELNFVNHVFPSGGVTGISYFGVRMSRRGEISGGKATLVQVMKLASGFITFEILVVFGLLCLAALGRVNNLVILVATAISTLLLVGTALFAYIVGSQARIDHFFTAVTRGLNRLIHVVRRRHPETINVERARGVFQDFHDNYRQLRGAGWQQLRGLLWYGFLANLTEVLAVYVVYIAFDKFVNFGAVIFGYAIANFAGLVSVLPGGIGIYEGLMTATLAATGISPSVSLPVTIMYRVANTLIQIPPGYILYQRALNRGEPVPTRE